MIIAKVGIDKEETWNELRVEGHMVASVWGRAAIRRNDNGVGYMVIIRDDYDIVGFYHVDLVVAGCDVFEIERALRRHLMEVN
ncbi:hypothetical protein ES707_20476 [subsurface metagenome]